MAAEKTDLSELIRRITEHPELIEQIAALTHADTDEAASGAQPTETKETAAAAATPHPSDGRRELLLAMRPYLSPRRAQAMTSLLTVLDLWGGIHS